MDKKELDVSESDSNFAGNVKFHRANSYRSSSRSASPFRRGDSKSPVRVAAFARKLDNLRREKLDRQPSHISRSQYYRSNSPQKSSDPRNRFDYSSHFRGESPHCRGRSPGRSSFGRSDSRHASSRDRGRSNSRPQKTSKGLLLEAR